MTEYTRSKVRIPPSAALAHRQDIDAAINRRDLGDLKNFADEVRASRLDQKASRAYEILSLLEAKATWGLITTN